MCTRRAVLLLIPLHHVYTPQIALSVLTSVPVGSRAVCLILYIKLILHKDFLWKILNTFSGEMCASVYRAFTFSCCDREKEIHFTSHWHPHIHRAPTGQTQGKQTFQETMLILLLIMLSDIFKFLKKFYLSPLNWYHNSLMTCNLLFGKQPSTVCITEESQRCGVCQCSASPDSAKLIFNVIVRFTPCQQQLICETMSLPTLGMTGLNFCGCNIGKRSLTDLLLLKLNMLSHAYCHLHFF